MYAKWKVVGIGAITESGPIGLSSTLRSPQQCFAETSRPDVRLCLEKHVIQFGLVDCHLSHLLLCGLPSVFHSLQLCGHLSDVSPCILKARFQLFQTFFMGALLLRVSGLDPRTFDLGGQLWKQGECYSSSIHQLTWFKVFYHTCRVPCITFCISDSLAFMRSLISACSDTKARKASASSSRVKFSRKAEITPRCSSNTFPDAIVKACYSLKMKIT